MRHSSCEQKSDSIWASIPFNKKKSGRVSCCSETGLYSYCMPHKVFVKPTFYQPALFALSLPFPVKLFSSCCWCFYVDIEYSWQQQQANSKPACTLRWNVQECLCVLGVGKGGLLRNVWLGRLFLKQYIQGTEKGTSTGQQACCLCKINSESAIISKISLHKSYPFNLISSFLLH